MIRFLDSAALPQPIYAVEVAGRLYTPEEVAAIVGAALAYHAAVLACDGIVAAEQALFGAIGEPTEGGHTACALCRTPITQKPLGRRRKYCGDCAAKFGHRTSTTTARRMARKSVPGEN